MLPVEPRFLSQLPISQHQLLAAVCAGTSLTMNGGPTAGTTPYVSHAWTGTGATSLSNTITQNPSFSSATAGIYTLTYTVTDFNGCTASNDIEVTVNPSIVAEVSIDVTTGTNSSCAGEAIGFTAIINNGGTMPVYQWTVNGTNVGTDTDTYSSTTFVDGDVVLVELTSNALCATGNPVSSNDITVSITSSVTFYEDNDNDGYGNDNVTTQGCIAPTGYVSDSTDCNDNDPAITGPPTVTLNSFGTVCNNSAAVELTGGTPAGGTYSGTGGVAGYFDAAAAGMGTHVITYTYSNGCTESADEDIGVDNCTGIMANSINSGLYLYPNPTNNIVNVHYFTGISTDVILKITDVRGQVIFTDTKIRLTGEYNESVSIGEYAKGMYIFQLTTDQQTMIKNVILD